MYTAKQKFVLIPQNGNDRVSKLQIGFAEVQFITSNCARIKNANTIYKGEFNAETLPEWVYIPEKREFGETVTLEQFQNTELEQDNWFQCQPDGFYHRNGTK